MKDKPKAHHWISPSTATAMRLDQKVRCSTCEYLYKIGRTCSCMKLNLTTYDNASCRYHEPEGA